MQYLGLAIVVALLALIVLLVALRLLLGGTGSWAGCAAPVVFSCWRWPV